MMEKRGAVLASRVWAWRYNVMVLLIITAGVPTANAVNIHDGAGTVGAAFLKIEGGSRLSGWVGICGTC